MVCAGRRVCCTCFIATYTKKSLVPWPAGQDTHTHTLTNSNATHQVFNDVGVVGCRVHAGAVRHSGVVYEQVGTSVVRSVCAVVKQVGRHEDTLLHHVIKR